MLIQCTAGAHAEGASAGALKAVQIADRRHLLKKQAAAAASARDNYSVHKSEAVQAVPPEWAAADVELWYRPAYAPELSAIEPVWPSVKDHALHECRDPRLGGLKGAVDASLTRKAIALRSAH